jgi:hypothetical protein
MNQFSKKQSCFLTIITHMKSKQISLQNKIMLFNINVNAYLLYGCETWEETREIPKELQTCK